MGPWLVLFVGLIYLIIAADFAFRNNNWWMASVYFGYAFANVGLFQIGK